MSRFVATEEYNQALKLGQKEYKEASAAGKQLHPLVLDELLPNDFTESVVDAGLVEIPAERIVGVKAAGRVTAFSASFRPLLDQDLQRYKHVVCENQKSFHNHRIQ